MVKLLIVDDEQIEREGLQAILQRGYPELEIAQAKNGKIAVQLADEWKPDLILMDIKMPGMNGLEAIEIIIAANPGIKFIMVTAYDTFDYARQAIKLGVKDYLLKPSKASEIVATVGKVLGEIEEERQSQESMKHQQDVLKKALPLVETDVVTQLLFDHVHEVHLDVLIEMLDRRKTGESFVMLVLLPSGSESFYTAIKERVRQVGSGWVGALYGRQLPIVVFRDPEKSFRFQATELALEILALTQSTADWFIGIGNVRDEMDRIRQSYQESLIATMDTSLPVKYRFYSDVKVVDSLGDGHQAKQREKELIEQIRLGQWEQVRTDVMELIDRFEQEDVNLLQAQQRTLELLWIVSRVLGEMGIETGTPIYSFQSQEYRQLRTETEQWLERMRQSYTEHYSQVGPDAIYQVKRYIMEHSHEDISLEAIARRVSLSPFYISKLFKEQLGINYIDFLTECRIEKAKRLMSDPSKSLKEITFEVGYHDPNYFSKVFKKMCAASPTEYRKMLLGNHSAGG
ncbi:response regulator [Marinicrinis lubricantis]|uniref:Response regulator n=1 Tax=Marinicrinis lubricantis TaxID=2086470 RepID=A0ABW1IPU2_9BACL